MTLKLGAYTACLHDRPLADALGASTAWPSPPGTSAPAAATM